MESLVNRLPEAFYNRMKKDLDQISFRDYLDSLNTPYRKTLRVNTLKTTSADLKNKLTDSISETNFLENSYYISDSISINTNPYHFAGLFYMQELSAQYPVSLLHPNPHEIVLDLCAAPGGKTSQISSYMQNTGLLISNEIVSSRAQILNSNLERLGVTNSIILNMSPSDLCPILKHTCHAVLVDAPCSGEGMFRRDPEVMKEWSVDNVLSCQKRQMSILESACECVMPGGRLVYSTCTFSKEEDEDVVSWFLEKHTDFELVSSKKLYPHMSNGDGQFAALFLRKGTLNISSRSIPFFKNNKDDLKIIDDFLKESFQNNHSPVYISPKTKKCYLLPEFLPGHMDKMHLIRTGVLAGEICSNRFEPDHCLYLSKSRESLLKKFNLSEDQFKQFITGNVISCGESLKGYTTITFDDYPIGFGKAVNGTMKNHLPKGLRIHI